LALVCCLEEEESIAQDIKELAARIDESVGEGEFPDGVNKVQLTPSGLTEPGLAVKLFFVALDMALDLWTIVNYIMTDNFMFAAVMIHIYYSSFLTDWAAGHIQNLHQSIKRTLQTGVMAPGVLEILDREAGYEAFLSIGVTAYALPFANQEIVSFTLGCLSLGVATINLGLHLDILQISNYGEEYDSEQVCRQLLTEEAATAME